MVSLLRFHWASTMRPVLRNAAVQMAALAVLVGLSSDKEYTCLIAAQAVARGEPAAMLALALWLGFNVFSALGFLGATSLGWHRHLALGRTDRRRAALGAILGCQGPVLALGWILWFWGLASTGSTTGLWVPVVLPALGWALGIAVIPWRPRWISLLGVAAAGGLLAGFLASQGSGSTMLGLLWALSCFGAVEMLDPAPAVSTRSRRFGRLRLPGFGSGRLALALPWRLSLRAIGIRRLLGYGMTTALALGCSGLFLANNVLEPWQATLGVRVGGGLALLGVMVPAAGDLRKLRPPWPWLRSLPGSSRRRLLDDAGVLGMLSVPGLIIAAVMSPWALPPLLATTLFHGVRLASALRRESTGITRLGAQAIAEPWVLQAMVAAWPVLGWGLILALPWAVARGEDMERSMKVGAWRGRRQALAGDSGR